MVITSCIHPFSQQVSLTDVTIREKLHLQALLRWLTEGKINDIVICDNSAYKYPEEFIQIADENGKNLEILSFQADKAPTAAYGKGYGEGELMGYVFEHSRLMHDADYFFKITGKLYIGNHAEYLDQLLDSPNNRPDFIFNHPANYFFHPVQLVYTDFYLASKASFARFLSDVYKQVRDAEGIYLEHVFLSHLKKEAAFGSSFEVQTMYPVPVKSGQMGSTDNQYGKSKFWYFIKNLILRSPLVVPLFESKNSKLSISIVTCCFNAADTLGRTMESVLNQTVSPMEYVVVDGGSTDGTVALIASFQPRFEAAGIRFVWKSEADRGIGDAFNKGIAQTSGDWVGLINADDWYESTALEQIEKHFQPDTDVFCGELKLYQPGAAVSHLKLASRPERLVLGMYVMHPTVFVRRDLLVQHPFDINLRISMDYDVMLRLRASGARFKAIPAVIAHMQLGGVSADRQKMWQEEQMVKQRHLSPSAYFISRFYFQITKLIFELKKSISKS